MGTVVANPTTVPSSTATRTRPPAISSPDHTSTSGFASNTSRSPGVVQRRPPEHPAQRCHVRRGRPAHHHLRRRDPPAELLGHLEVVALEPGLGDPAAGEAEDDDAGLPDRLVVRRQVEEAARYVDRVLYRTTTRSALSMTSSTTVRWSANVLGYQRSQATNPARSVVPPGP